MSARYDRPSASVTGTPFCWQCHRHIVACYRARRREVVAWSACGALGGLAVAGWMLALI